MSDAYRENIENLTGLWRSLGASSHALPGGARLLASASWPHRRWVDWGTELDDDQIGALVDRVAVRGLTWEIAAYAVLSLTVVRMAPVALCLAGLKLPIESQLFIGWFGPRGLASVVFAVIVAGEGLPHGDTISAVVACTVLFSILAHGVTANRWASRYSARARRA